MPSKNSPRISLCIPNYNRAEDLLVVVEDCKNQTVSPFEIIIQDDKSAPDQLNIVKKGLKLTKNMRFYTSRVNRGLAGNTNHVIKRARGDYLAIINNDDRISKYYVEEMLNAIRTYPDRNVYTTNGMALNRRGELVGDYRINRGDRLFSKGDAIRVLWQRYFFSIITISGTTFYKTSFIKENLFVEKYVNEADLYNSLRFLSREEVVYIDKPIYYVRLHPDQESIKNKLTEQRLERYITNCVSIYHSGARQNSSVPQYLTKVKGVYFLQLFIKYRYDLDRIKRLLKIHSNTELALIMSTIPGFILNMIQKLLLFRAYRGGYQKFVPDTPATG